MSIFLLDGEPTRPPGAGASEIDRTFTALRQPLRSMTHTHRRPVVPSTSRTLFAACLAMLTLGATPAHAAFPGGNGRIAFNSDRDGDLDIYSVTPGGSALRNLTADSPGEDALPNWSPDGRQIAFMSDRVTPTNPTADFELFVMKADGSQPRQITSNLLDDEDPAWSPSGRALVFSRDFNPVRGEIDNDLMVVADTGLDERKLTNTPGVNDLDPNWSPDGSRIAFTNASDGDDEIYTIDPQGANVRKLTRNKVDDGNSDDDPDVDAYPNWSPDGRMITFTSNRDDKYEIYRMRRDGRRQTRLTVTTGDYGNARPAWSPNGRLIAFSSSRAGSPDIYRMRADGKGKATGLVVRNDAEEYDADWQPRR